MALNLFGNTSMAAPASQPSAFAFPSAVASTAAAPAFNFGNSAAPSTGFFGATSTTGGGLFSAFGQPTAASSAPVSAFNFSGAATTTAAPLFGGVTLQQTPKFGLGQMTTATGGGGLFNFNLGAPAQQPQQAVAQQNVPGMQLNVSEIANFISSLTNPPIYGDERDRIIAKFNQLQAFCGQGKGFFSSVAQPIDYTPSNPFCRLKAICYNRLDGTKDEDGLISLMMKQPEKNVKANLQLIIDELYKLLGSKSNISVNVDATKALPDDKTEIVIFITEAGITGIKRRILASESYAFFNQANIRQQLTNVLSVEQILLKTMLPLNKMNEYLAVPQEGVDLLVWNQAVAENSDPKRLIPYPILGFDQLKERQKLQKAERDVHEACLTELSKRLERLEEQTVLKQTKLEELNSNQYALYHRLLTLIGRYFANTRRNYSFEANEENLKTKIDTMNAQLNGSIQLKNRLAEIVSNLNILSVSSTIKKPIATVETEEGMDEDLLLEIRQYLRKSQDAAENLTQTLKKNQSDMNVIRKIIDGKR